ncbi:RNA-binding S4 domain-containing protein [Candidatus Sororendozoicomonas aggregata]|uniref:RNA-binding S4 domain-containing protein n=1 Tax=Candidatus Sororendozoicomonas aggregata TaxID=3073239 RepID=UPI002ED665C2
MKALSEKIRLDKWLWAARFYKTRSLAKEAIDGGKVHINGARCKPGKEPKVGDTIRLRAGWDEKTVVVQALSDKRQKAEVAQQLYAETEESIASREKTALERKSMNLATARPDRKPNKKERRKLRDLKND